MLCSCAPSCAEPLAQYLVPRPRIPFLLPQRADHFSGEGVARAAHRLTDGIYAFRWRGERGHHRVSGKVGALLAHSHDALLPPAVIAAESVFRAASAPSEEITGASGSLVATALAV